MLPPYPDKDTSHRTAMLDLGGPGATLALIADLIAFFCLFLANLNGKTNEVEITHFSLFIVIILIK